ncbi:MAG: hypothetical protein ACO1TE_26400 [Prosthecobacter sp.]
MSLKTIRKDIQRRMLRRSLRIMSSYIMEKRYETECRRARNHLAALLPVVHGYVEKQRTGGGFYWDSTALKMLELHRLLIETKPKFVVELGGGATTCVVASAISAWGGKLLSIDETSQYSNSTFERLPEDLRRQVRFEIVPKVEDKDAAGGLQVHYDKRLQEIIRDFLGGRSQIDLLYVDGPSNQKDKKLLPCNDCSILLDAGFKIPVLAFDCRHESVRHFLGTKHALQRTRALHHRAPLAEDDPWPVGPARHHSIFHTIGA